MAGFSEAVADAVQSSVCAVLAGSDSATSFVNSLIGQDGDYGNIARVLRRRVCNNPDDTVNLPGPPFTGGQCENVLYDVTVQYTKGSNPTVRTGFGSARGPISSYDWFQAGNSYEFRVTGYQGNVYDIDATLAASPPNTVDVSWTRRDGQPDNCGDPPAPAPPPFAPTTINKTINYVDNSNNNYSEDIDVTINAPFVAIGGAIIAPVLIAGNTFQLAGKLEVSPNLKFEFEPEISVGGGQTDAPPPSPLPGEPEGDGPSGPRRIIGAVVTTTAIDQPRATQIGQGGNPDIWVPRVANLAFYVATADHRAWTADIPIKNLRQFVPCPTPLGAVDVKVTPEPGFTVDCTPVWSEPA